MEDQTKKSKSRVSVEDLLKLKRAEKPDDAFWDRFDAQLHQRMLQTLVKKDPWHLQVLRCFRLRIVQGAAFACVAAAAFVGLDRSGTFGGGEAPSMAQANPGDNSSPGYAASGEAFLGVLQDAVPSALAYYSANMEGIFGPNDADQTDFGIGHVHRAEPAPEARFTREFSADNVRMASNQSETFRVDYASNTLDSGNDRVGRLVY